MAGKQNSSGPLDIENAAVEKSSVDHKEEMVGNMSREDQEFLDSFPPEKQKRAVRKVDVSQPDYCPQTQDPKRMIDP